jgi:hypothetical protein
MRIFLTRVFARFARGERISDAVLRDAVRRAEAGLIDADLGGGVIKQRVARAGGGKSGGYRTIILYRRGNRAVFAEGFAKRDRDNIGPQDLLAHRKLAGWVLAQTEEEMNASVARNVLREISNDEEV